MSGHYEADKQKKAQQKSGKDRAGLPGGLAAKTFLFGLLWGLIALLILMAVAGLRGTFILAKTFRLYPAALLAAIFLSVFVKVKLNSKILGFLTFAVVCVSGWMGATAYYKNSSMIFPSVYCADFIQELPGGKIPVLYQKIKKQGAVVAKLSAGEKVTVNGVNLKRDEFNITTARGKTGWVELAAFPDRANKMLSISIGIDGIDSEEIAIDRQVEPLMKKYLDVDRNLRIENIPTDFYKMSDATLSRSTRVNTAAPLLSVECIASQKGAELSDVGNIVLENILYADDCTILYLTVTDPKIWVIAGDVHNTTAWQKSLTVMDLDTGEEYPLMRTQRNYHRTFSYKRVRGKYISSVVYFFPPFKSRYFSLTHNGESAIPVKKNGGYGGILGLISSLTGLCRPSDYFFDWDFPEVRVR